LFMDCPNRGPKNQEKSPRQSERLFTCRRWIRDISRSGFFDQVQRVVAGKTGIPLSFTTVPYRTTSHQQHGRTGRCAGSQVLLPGQRPWYRQG